MSFVLKNCAIIICSIYYYFRLLNIPYSKENAARLSILSVLSIVFSTLTDYYHPAYTTCMTILYLSIFLSHITQTSFALSITTTTLSFGFSYFLATILCSIVSIFLLLLSYKETLLPSRIICCFLQLLLMPFPFRFARFKNGMPFLRKKSFSTSGMIICICIIISSIFMNSQTYQPFYTLIIFFLFLLGILIYRYWQNNITKVYLDRLHERNIIDLNEIIAEQSKEITRLDDENKRLAAIVHKDNKLIPTLEFSMQTYIQKNNLTNTIDFAEGNQLLQWLNTLSIERKEILHKQEITCHTIKKTNVLCIDQYLKYIQSTALDSNIDFQVNISFDVEYFLKHIISKNDFETLLQDLLDDALHTTQENNGGYILLSMHLISDIYTISIFDSGTPFTTDVLIKWGLEQITTRPNGTGIGMMTTYNILKKYQASFIIHEFDKNNHSFTKEISISFDKKSNYILQTNRSEQELNQLSERPDLQIIYSS